VIFSIYQVRKRRQQGLQIEQTVFEKMARGKSFSTPEIDLLKRLFIYLKKNQKRYEIIENPYIFNACVKKLREHEDVSSALLVSLRMKLGFKAEGPERIPHSTAELTINTPLLLISKGKREVSGRIIKIENHSFLVGLEEAGVTLSPGSRITVYCQKRSGLYEIKAVVRKVERGMVWFLHSEEIRRIQRRRFYRKRVSFSVYVKRPGPEQQWVRTSLLDLGGGGASIENPWESIRSGEEIEIVFPEKKPELRIHAFVVRTSGAARNIHVRFGPLSDADRDRIIGYIFKRSV
jgi:c-di-GMP-binding flagellar brake protein YcgR